MRYSDPKTAIHDDEVVRLQPHIGPTGMSDHHQSLPRHALTIPLLAFACCVIVANRDGLRLSFDGYYYVEYAKQLRHSLPESFGTAWPFGWPMLGALTGLFGLSAYHGLLALAVLAWAWLIKSAMQCWPWSQTGTTAGILIFTALATLAASISYTLGVFSEIPFAAVTFAFACSLARWPERSAIIASCSLALLAFAIRYTGGLHLLALGLWLIGTTGMLRPAGRVKFAWGAVALSALIAIALITWNRIATGYFSGHPRGYPGVPDAWWSIAADFGWSPIALLGGIGTRDLLGFGSMWRIPFGLLIYSGLLIGTSIVAWRTTSSLKRSIAFVVLTYAIGIVILRRVGDFDALYNARMSLPLLLPVLIIFAGSWARHRLVLLGAVVLLSGNIALNVRGISPQISADVRGLAERLDPLAPAEVVVVNDQARTLSAILRAPVVRFDRRIPDNTRYVIFSGAGSPDGNKPLTPSECEQANSFAARKTFEVVINQPDLLVLEYSPSSP